MRSGGKMRRIDVGKKFLAVCVMIGPLDGEARVERRRSELQSRNWRHCGTGSCWKV
jgi:hypothetical protein